MFFCLIFFFFLESLQDRFTGYLVLRLETRIGTGIPQDTTKKSQNPKGFYFHPGTSEWSDMNYTEQERHAALHKACRASSVTAWSGS